MQVKKGYLRGVRGVLLTQLNADGSVPASPEKHWIDTAQSVSVEAQISEGEEAELRGGDKLLAKIEEDDVFTGVNLSFTDARFDAKATELIAGGTLVYDDVNTDEIIGWEAPTVEEQGTKTPFKAEVFVQSFDQTGNREAYLKYDFRFAKGSPGSITHGDREWGTPEFSLQCKENPSTGESVYSRIFVDSLPPEAS